MIAWRHPNLPAVLLCGIALLGACGDDRSGGGDGPAATGDGAATTGDGAELAARLPGGATTIAVVDLDAARDQLGLPEGTGIDDIDLATEPERRRLLSVAGLGLRHLSRAQESPLTSALDTGLVHQAAAVGTFDLQNGAAIVRTDQEYAALAEALRSEGYDEVGDLLVSPRPAAAVTYPGSNPVTARLALGDRSVDGGFVTIGFEYVPDPPLQIPAQLVLGDLVPAELYDCP